MKKTNKTVYALVFAAAAFFLVSAGEEPAQESNASRDTSPLSMSKDLPVTPVSTRDLIA